MSTTKVTRPGISTATLEANEVRFVETPSELMEYGFRDAGMVIPYRQFPSGEAIIDNGQPYARLRLAVPQGKKKYHQNFGTTIHAFIPAGLPKSKVEQLVIVEGEFKAMSLVEAGIPAVGMSGFYGFRFSKVDNQLVSELAAVLAVLKPQTILFLGDNDTALNFQFADAAIAFARLVPACTVRLPRIPLNLPKGIDDVREELGGKINDLWKELTATAVPVNGGDSRTDLTEVLLRRELDHIRQASPAQRNEWYLKLAKMASFYKRAERERFIKIAQELGITVADFNKLLQEQFDKRREEDKTKSGAQFKNHAPALPPPSTPPPAAMSSSPPALIKELPPIVNAADLIKNQDIKTPPEVVKGLIHQNTKTVFGGCSKAGKTWIMLDLAYSVSSGTPFWGLKTTRGEVLYINFEIHEAFIRERLIEMVKAKKVTGQIQPDVWTLRGHAASMGDLLHGIIDKVKTKKYSLIMIDPIYKIMCGRDENSASQMAELGAEMDRLSAETGAAIIYAAHFPKGDNTRKDHMDRIAGTGLFARDADSIVTLTSLDYPDRRAYGVETTLRNFRTLEPFAVEWKFPLMVPNNTLNPNKLKQPGRKALCSAADIASVLNKPAKSTKWLTAARAKFSISESTYHRLRREALESNLVVLKKGFYRATKGSSTAAKAKAAKTVKTARRRK
jgi:hypothetical protein